MLSCRTPTLSTQKSVSGTPPGSGWPVPRIAYQSNARKEKDRTQQGKNYNRLYVVNAAVAIHKLNSRNNKAHNTQ